MLTLPFEKAHEAWFDAALRTRTAKSRAALEKGHGHGERLFLRNVWWPAFGTFEHLHPQYEVRDFADGVRSLDFAYLRPPFRICIEVDGYAHHVEKVTRARFADNDLRQDHLVADFWVVLRFSYDDVKDNPTRCRQTLLGVFGRLFRDRAPNVVLTPNEKELVRLAARCVRPITPSEAAESLRVCDKTARAALKSLVEKRLLRPAGTGKERIRFYEPALEPQLLLYMLG